MLKSTYSALELCPFITIRLIHPHDILAFIASPPVVDPIAWSPIQVYVHVGMVSETLDIISVLSIVHSLRHVVSLEVALDPELPGQFPDFYENRRRIPGSWLTIREASLPIVFTLASQLRYPKVQRLVVSRIPLTPGTHGFGNRSTRFSAPQISRTH